MIETLTREVLIEQIKRNIELVADGSHDDTINERANPPAMLGRIV